MKPLYLARAGYLTLLACGLILALTACVSQPHPTKNSFALEVKEEGAPAAKAPAKRRTLLAATVTAAAGYDNRALVYKVGPDQYESDFYNEFVAPPSRLLADQAAQYLDERSRKVRAVKSPGLVLAEFGLETYLEAIYGDFTVSPPEAVLAIRFTVNDLRGSAPRVLLDKTYRQARPLATKDPAALVAALGEALGDVLADLKKDIDKAVR